jgi:CDP-diacylglycerol--glycerol-3-phosphate 3-phosphatidyltransferase
MSLPNQLTVLRIVLTPLVVFLLLVENLYCRYLSLLVFLLASLTDWYDGYIARKLGYVTKSGKFLDPLADKVLVLSIFFTLAWLDIVKAWMVAAIVGRDVLVTGLRSYAAWKRQPIVTSISAKWKTAGQLTAIYLILVYLVAQAHALATDTSPAWLVWLKDSQVLDKMMWVVTLFTLATGIQYLFENWHHVRSLMLAFYRAFAPGNLAK